MNKNDEPLTYQQAMAEVEKIVAQIENNSLNVDEMAATTKKALSLLEFCSQRLRTTEEEIAPLIKG